MDHRERVWLQTNISIMRIALHARASRQAHIVLLLLIFCSLKHDFGGSYLYGLMTCCYVSGV